MNDDGFAGGDWIERIAETFQSAPTLVLEFALVSLLSGVIGFLIAQRLYAGQVRARNEALRTVSTRWRRAADEGRNAAARSAEARLRRTARARPADRAGDAR